MITKLTDDLMSGTRNFWLLIIAILLILSGLIVIFNPLAALMASAMFVGFMFIVIGCGYLMAFQQKESALALALGILDIIIGLVFLMNIDMVTMSMPVIFALWILFNGITEIIMGYQIRQNNDNDWKILFWGGICSILFSLFIFIHPLFGSFIVTTLIGIYLIAYGVFEIVRYIKCC